MTAHIRIRYKILGGHVHCRVFTAEAQELTYGKCGDLIFGVKEWLSGGVKDALARIAQVIEEEAG